MADYKIFKCGDIVLQRGAQERGHRLQDLRHAQ